MYPQSHIEKMSNSMIGIRGSRFMHCEDDDDEASSSEEEIKEPHFADHSA